MKRLLVIAALIAFAMLRRSARRARQPRRDAADPACAVMRNNVIGAPHLPEPNRDDARKAMALAGGDTQPFGNIGVVRRQYVHAFDLLRKIDEEGMDRLALLPSDTPRIDLIIDRHVVNLVWARTMLGTLYEQGRAPAVDCALAGAFFQKGLDTNSSMSCSCIHTAPVAALAPLHLAGILIYGEGVAKDRGKAKALLQGVGDKAESILYLSTRTRCRKLTPNTSIPISTIWPTPSKTRRRPRGWRMTRSSPCWGHRRGCSKSYAKDGQSKSPVKSGLRKH